MDAEISELGSGTESANGLVWRTDHKLPVKKKKQEWCCSKSSPFPLPSIPSAFVLLPEFPGSIPEAGCGQRPRKKAINTMSYLSCKKIKKEV